MNNFKTEKSDDLNLRLDSVNEMKNVTNQATEKDS
jgi:hypothetical protein